MELILILVLALARIINGGHKSPSTDVETLECADGTYQIGVANADFGGCGMYACDTRYDKPTIGVCAAYCGSLATCKAYSWAPLGGDRNHVDKTVCTVYNSDTPNQIWGPNQIMCSRPRLECPAGSEQIAGINADIGGCGLEGCDQRYTKATIEDCAAYCTSRNDCKAYNWAPISGDKNHLGVAVCTVYDAVVPNQNWGPLQIMCLRPTLAKCCQPKWPTKGGRIWKTVCPLIIDPEVNCEALYNKDSKEKCVYTPCSAVPLDPGSDIETEVWDDSDSDVIFMHHPRNKAVVDADDSDDTPATCCDAKYPTSGGNVWKTVCPLIQTQADCESISNKDSRDKCEWDYQSSFCDDQDTETDVIFMHNNINRAVGTDENVDYSMYLLYAFLLSIGTVLMIFMYKICKKSKKMDGGSPLLTYDSI